MFFNFKFLKLLNKKGLGTLPKILFSSLLVMFSFYMTPFFINKLNDQSIEYKNNSKAVLAYTLNSKEKGLDGSQNDFNENEISLDLFSYAEKINIPVLCIGWGMQVLNYFYGGKNESKPNLENKFSNNREIIFFSYISIIVYFNNCIIIVTSTISSTHVFIF